MQGELSENKRNKLTSINKKKCQRLLDTYQDVVPIDIVPDYIPEQHTASQMQNPYLDNSHTIEVAMKDITVRISNDADPVLLTRTFRLLQELSC